MNLAIIGCGPIGQRHFESILKLDNRFRVFLVDKSSNRLKECKQIFLKNKKKNCIYFFKNISEIKQNINFVIVATNSKNRFSAINNLFKYKSPKFIILEKFLFNRISHFEKVKKLFDLNNTKVWVNQWMSTEFSKLLNIFKEKDKINITVKGKNWNICSNAVHWIDFFHNINNRSKIILSKSNLKNLIIENKRKGFYETFGTLEFQGKNKNKLLLECKFDKNKKRKSLLTLSGKKIRVKLSLNVNSLNGFIFDSGKKKTFNLKIKYLSERTSYFVKDIVRYNKCSLPTYEQSVMHHKLIFETFKKHFDKNSLKKNKLLLVT
jgi:hypothetical protein